MLVTTDLIGAYLNIPQEDGSACGKEALNERADQTITSSLIVKLWKQLIGVAMGIHPVPPYANIYISRRIDKQIEELALKYGVNRKIIHLYYKKISK